MESEPLSPAALAARREYKREYMRKWRKKNADKAAQIERRYWETKAAKKEANDVKSAE